MIVFSFLLAATATAITPAEIPRMEPLIEVAAEIRATGPSDPGTPASYCTQDKRWCMFIARDVDQNTTTLNIFNGQLPPIIKDGRSYARDVGTYSFSASDAGGGMYDASVKIWPTIIRQPTPRDDGLKLNETITIGIETGASTGYSGGGAQSTWLDLYQLVPTIDGSVPEPINFGTVLSAPLSASKLIRACFGDEDYKQRRGACHDEYDFQASITLGKTMPDGTPQLLYKSIATATPGSSRLSKDNSGHQLSVADLETRRDLKCSYRRVYIYNGEQGAYFTAKPTPDCSDFTTP